MIRREVGGDCTATPVPRLCHRSSLSPSMGSKIPWCPQLELALAEASRAITRMRGIRNSESKIHYFFSPESYVRTCRTTFNISHNVRCLTRSFVAILLRCLRNVHSLRSFTLVQSLRSELVLSNKHQDIVVEERRSLSESRCPLIRGKERRGTWGSVNWGTEMWRGKRLDVEHWMSKWISWLNCP